MATVTASELMTIFQGLADRTAYLYAQRYGTALATLSSIGEFTYSYPIVTLAAYGGSGTDKLARVLGGKPGDHLMITPAAGSEIIIDDTDPSPSRIRTPRNPIRLASTYDHALLMCVESGFWVVVAAWDYLSWTATISDGTISATAPGMTIDTEGAAATDDLTGILGGLRGQTLSLGTAADGRDVVIKHGTSSGLIRTYSGADVTLGTNAARAFLVCRSPNNWSLLSYCP